MVRHTLMCASGIGALLLIVTAAVAQSEIPGAASPTERLETILDEAAALDSLETVIIAQDGNILVERGYRNHAVTDPTNIKSASKTVISALVGIAIDKGILEGVDQMIAPILADDLPEDADPRMQDITIGHLLSMQAGLQRTSGENYGRWVASSNWVRFALDQPFADDPGGAMQYSTGSSHLLSAILTKKSGQSTLELAREWLAEIDGFSIASWDRDPQGIYLGGNQMAMSPRSLLAFGEVYRNGGLSADGARVVPEDWIEESWQPRTTSRLNGDGYGYGWFIRSIAGERVPYAWGYGGQMLYIVPDLNITVVMTSDETSPSASTGYREDLHQVLGQIIESLRQAPARQ